MIFDPDAKKVDEVPNMWVNLVALAANIPMCGWWYLNETLNNEMSQYVVITG